MKFHDLKKALDELDDEQLDCEVVVYDSLVRSYFPARAFRICSFNEVLDKDQPFLIFNGSIQW